MSAAELTRQGIAAHRAGDHTHAVNLFVQAVQADPAYEMAWLWLASALETPGERRYCLDRALAVNPQSQPAQRGIAQLGAMAPTLPAVLATVEAPPELMWPMVGAPPAKKRGITCGGLLLTGVLAVVCVVGFLALIGGQVKTAPRSSSVPAVSAPAVSASSSVAEYTTKTTRETSALGEGLSQFAALLQEPQLGSAAWRADAATQLAAIRTAHRHLSAMQDIPPEMTAIHASLVKATGDCDQAAFYAGRGLDTGGTADFSRAADLMGSCTTKIEATTNMLRAQQQ